MDTGSTLGRPQDPLVAGRSGRTLPVALVLAATIAVTLATAQVSAPASAPAHAGAAIFLAGLVSGSPPTAQESKPAAPAASEATTLEAVADHVAEAFDTHQFVFLGSTHGSKKVHDFLLTLLSRPAFQQRATDVLVEWATPAHQETVDRALLSLERVPDDELRAAWFETDSPDLWARLPQIPEFYARVREINARLEPPRRIRVIGGNDPMDWSRTRTTEDLARIPFRTNWVAHLLLDHYLPDPRQKLLVVYGDGHIYHNQGGIANDMTRSVEHSNIFVVGTILELNPEEEELVARLGDPARPFFIAGDRLPEAGPYPNDLFYARADPLLDHMDCVAYLGPEPDTDLRNKIEFTAAQKAELARRDGIRGDLKELMKLRLEHRADWFRAHPNDLPARP